MEKNPVLVVDQLTKIYNVRGWMYARRNPFVAVDRISFNLDEGEILGFLGPNGAGKTTTIQLLLGLMTPTSGSISYFGKDFFAHRSEVLQKVTFASAYVRLSCRLSIYENLDFYGQLYGIGKNDRAQRIKDFLTFFRMWEIRDRLTGVLSAGQITRIMLAKAFLPNPSIVLLDEPTASLDPDVAADVRHFILKQREERNISVLFTSHNMGEVEELCDRVLILKNGTIIANNTPEEIAKKISDTKVYLMVSTHDLPPLEQLLAKQNIRYSLNRPFVEIEIKDDMVAQLLTTLAENKIQYSQIYIAQPTLEDYFLHVALQR